MKIKRPVSKQPIPPQAKMVFKGRLFEVYQWEQKMFDGSMEIFEKIKRADTVNVIPVTEEGKIVLGKQKQPGCESFIGAFGGRIDEGESPLTAAKRELLEEAGMKAKKLILWWADQPLAKSEWAVYCFIAKGCRKVGKQRLEAGEKIKFTEVTFEKFIDLVAKENYRDFEIALKILKATRKPQELKKIKKLFNPM